MKKLLMILQLLLIACQAYAVDLYVIGGDVNGNNWLLEDPAGKMTPVSDGVWEWSGETLSSGFKINDGTWANPEYNIGSGGGKLSIGNPYYYRAGSDGNIMIEDAALVKNPHLTLDMNKGTILLQGEKDEETGEKYYFVGTFNDWINDSPESLMAKEGDQYVKRGVLLPDEHGMGRFKIAAPFWANSWGYGSYSDTDCITPQKTSATLTSEIQERNTDMYYNISGVYDVWWNPAASQISFIKTGDTPDDPYYYDYGDLYIIGDNVNGNHWMLGDASAKLVPVGKGQYEWSGTYLGNGFKINDGTWDSRFLNGVTLNIGSNGEGLVLDEPYYFYGSGSSENIGFATTTEVFNPIVSLDMNARTLIVSADGHALTLRLPDEAADGRYKNCVIELVDGVTGIKQRYIITDRLSYIFQGIGSKNEYSLRMFTPSNVEIAALEGIKMPKDDMEVSFTDIKTLYPVGLKILSPEGDAIVDGLTVEWFVRNSDGEYSYLRQGWEAGRWPAGTSLLGKVTLDHELATIYANPDDTLITVSEESSNITIPLSPLSRIRLTGQVVDESGSPMDGVTVTVRQLLNSKYPYSAVARTDRMGIWTAEAMQGAKPEIIFSAKDYVSQHKTLEYLSGDSEEISLGKIVLPTITGAKISLAVSYRDAGTDNISSFFTDYQNLALEVFNLTQGRRHDNISIQYPILAVLDEDIHPGDELRFTLSSITRLFAPVERTVKLDGDRKGSIEVAIVGKGGIKAGFSITDNPEVTASLYNSSGELVGKSLYNDASVEFTGLEAGEYSLLSMGRSDMMNAPVRLSLLSEIGLKEGKDYLLNHVEVTDGETTLISNPEIPAFDESPYYFTSDNSGVSANKSSITTGNYLTLRADVDFRGAYADKVENVSLIFDFPQGSDFVNQSVISGSALIPYTLEGTRLTIPLGNNWRKQVRFCVIPTVAGRFTATANLRFDYDGKEKVQPLGYASSNVKEMEITVPKMIQTPNFNVTGVTLANSQVSVFDDGALIATGKADSNGAWKVECELPEAYNLSVHPIHAEVVTPEGNTLMSEKQNVTYDMNAIRVSKVTMYHWNPELNRTCVSEFDFLNPKTTGSQWDLYYPEKKFTYTIEFTENNPDKVSNVVLYVHTADGQIVPVNAEYNENKGCWYATIDMGSEANAYYPVNCSIDFTSNTPVFIDSATINALYDTDMDLGADIVHNTTSYQKFIERLDNYSGDPSGLLEIVDSFNKEINATPAENVNEEEISSEVAKIMSMNPEEMEAYLESFGSEAEKTYREYFSEDVLEALNEKNYSTKVTLDGIEYIIRRTDASQFNESEIAEQGFNKLMTDGDRIYLKVSDQPIQCELIDFTRNLAMTLIPVSEKEIEAKVANRSLDLVEILFESALESLQEASETLGKVTNIVMEVVDYANDVVEVLVKAIDKDIAIAEKIEKMWYEQGVIDGEMSTYHIWSKKAADLRMKKANTTKWLEKIKGFKSTSLTKKLNLLGNVKDLVVDVKDWLKLYRKIKSKLPCKGNESYANELLSDVKYYGSLVCSLDVLNVVSSVTALHSSVVAVAGSVETGGLSMVVGGGVALAVQGVGMVAGWVGSAVSQQQYNRLKLAVSKLKCDRKSDDNENGGQHPSGSAGDNPKQDPSGYVYEAVRDNRVEGVQASIYYKETKEDMYGEPYDEVVLWNAEEYAQRNPLFTDERGMYRWDVPQGLWQVKFEKEGYVTAYSEWLPVPPPQLDVNIAISQAKQPEVIEAHAYEEGVEVRFDKFMKPLTLTKENIHVSVDGSTLPGSIILLDEGSDCEIAEDGVKYASHVRFIPETPLGLTTGEVRLTVSPNVLSYCGVPMGEVFTQTLDVEKEVQLISAEPYRVLYGEEKEITVFALPFEAAAGRTLNISSASDVILAIEESQLTLDADGKATVKVKGLLPGSTRLYFSIPDVTVTGESDVEVVTEIIEPEAPKSSRASGTEVYRGTKVELTTPTKDAVIYYTLDGSCPCDADGTRRKYTVPIVINDDTQILAMTMVGNNAEDVSDVVAFNYTLRRNAMDYTLPQGWSWISHTFENPLSADALLSSEGITRILSQRGEETGEMSATEAYKVETSSNVAVERLSDVAWNPSTPISLKTGMNWIGYPLSQAMTPGEAFSAMEPEAGDVVIGQRGFAEFDGEKWVGVLESMLPGEGYLYKSKSAKNLVYNNSIVSKARALKSSHAVAKGGSVNIHAYSDVMPLVSKLTDKGADLDCSRYELTAYVGDECRGIASMIDGLFLMNIHGAPEEEITLIVTDMTDFSQVEAAKLSFHEDVIGSLENPFEIDVFNTLNELSPISCDGSLTVEIKEKTIVIRGVDPKEIDMVKVLDMEGKVLFSAINPGVLRIPLPELSERICIVIVDASGKVVCRKVAF